MKYFLLYIKETLRFVLKPMSFLPAIMMMCIIFMLSSQEGTTSSQLSYKVGVQIFTVTNKVLDKGWSDAHIDQLSTKYQYYVRKTAHYTEYFLLGVSVAFPLYVYGVRGMKLIIFAGLFCFGYASLDEFHQSFVHGRGPSPKDVMIDSCGALTGIILTRIVGWTGRMTIFKPLSNHKDEDTNKDKGKRKNKKIHQKPLIKSYFGDVISMSALPAKDTTLNIKIDKQKKARLEELYANHGMTIEDAVDVFFEKTLTEGRIPFNTMSSKYNKDNITSINKSKNMVPQKAESRYYDSAKEMYNKPKF
ncbi:VanZ family protein [Butyrivibrio sp. LB2008]|uniref:VanZ family protein n=1 Tax=Butyrivibrio sp. LB2008 TaxID=1408305 RepID=UPI000B25FA57|nr:VanZ family protein [Butyrivibrio sp. LB2008]